MHESDNNNDKFLYIVHFKTERTLSALYRQTYIMIVTHYT